MAQRKHSFRFRMPWLAAAPESLSRNLKERSKSPDPTSIPIQQPSRPSEITPAGSPPSPSKTQVSPRIEPQKQSPLHPTPSPVITESPVSKPKPPSPKPVISPPPSSHAGSPNQAHIVHSSPKTQPKSPSHLASYGAVKEPKISAEEITHPASSPFGEEKEKMIVSEPQEADLKVHSPLREITKSPETSFQPESLSTQPAGSKQQPYAMPPSSPVSKTVPSFQPHPSSPLAPERNEKEFKAKPEESTSPLSSISQEEKEKMTVAASELVSQEAEPKMKSPSETIPKSPESSSQPENLSAQPTTATSGDEKRSISTTPKVPFETQNMFLQSKEKEKVVNKAKKEGKAKDRTISQPSQHTTASASGTKAPSAKAVRADKKLHEVRETIERKVMLSSSNSSGKDVRVVSSTDPGTRNVPSISPARPVSSSTEKAPLQKGIIEDISKLVHKLASVHPTQTMDDIDKQFSVITLTGDNRGATMHVGSEPMKTEGSIHIHRAYKTNLEESPEVTTDGEENTSNTEEDSDSSMEHGELGKAYVNSNIQSINNSLMFHGSITERDPGVQVTLPQKPAEPIKPDDKDTHRIDFNISRAQKSPYQPIVRRRYLRGLLREPSDSDLDNPDKPLRHGCKFSCDNHIEDIEIL